MISKLQFWLAILIASILGAGIALTTAYFIKKPTDSIQQPQQGGTTQNPSLLPQFRKASSDASMAVVNIRTTSPNMKTPEVIKLQNKSQTGSGVIISPDGYIVTNQHVINGAEEITIALKDKRTYKAKLVGRASNVDLVLLKVNAKDLPFIKYGNSDNVQVGDWVLAIGNPFDLTSTVTAGIISAKDRSIDLPHIENDPEVLESFLQTDAVVNPGNSGGALINAQGELIGINTAIASETGNYEGYSFAVPVNLVKKVMDDLLNNGSFQRAYLGVDSRDIDAKFATEIGLNSLNGVYISKIKPNGAAQAANLQQGDIIISVNDQLINTNTSLQVAIAVYPVGEKVKVTYMRGQKKSETDVTLKNKEGSTSIIKQNTSTPKVLGAKLMKVTNDEKQKYQTTHGVKVEQLGSGKLSQAGIKVGFVITHCSINGKRTDLNDVETLANLVKKCKSEGLGIHLEGTYESGDKAFYPIGF